MRCQTDPVTRLIHVIYTVPTDAPERLLVRSSWSPRGQNQWQPARIQPLVSDTARELLREEDWLSWTRGEVLELRAAGLDRTLVFNPYPEAQAGGRVDIDFRVELYAEDERLLSRLEAPASADNRDVVYLDDWSGVIQKEAVAPEDKPGCWRLETGLSVGASPYATGGTRLFGAAVDLPQLTMPLALKGPYAIFVYSFGGVRLRLAVQSTGQDEGKLVITWEAHDRAPAPFPLSLLYSAARGGPWASIAADLENTGQYDWAVSNEVPEQIFLRIEVRDEAGNLGVYESPEPVQLDRSRPNVRIQDIRPVSPSAGTAPRRYIFR